MAVSQYEEYGIDDACILSQRHEMVFVMVRPGLGEKITMVAKDHGIEHGAILSAVYREKGGETGFFDLLRDDRMEVVVLVCPKHSVDSIIEGVIHELEIRNEPQGMVFSMADFAPFSDGEGSKVRDLNSGGADCMFHSIIVMVEKGRGDAVIDAANQGGAQGGAILSGKGIGAHETSRFFNMEIVQPKEIIMILSARSRTNSIVSAIRDQLNMRKPEDGIIMVQGICQHHNVQA